MDADLFLFTDSASSCQDNKLLLTSLLEEDEQDASWANLAFVVTEGEINQLVMRAAGIAMNTLQRDLATNCAVLTVRWMYKLYLYNDRLVN